MEWTHYCLSSSPVFLPLLLLVTNLFVSIASLPISDDVFSSGASFGRILLQAKNPCPVDFEIQNYTIITSQCKGPQYPPNLCCQAFKDFACPFAEDLNDLTNVCSTTMFSYINIYGKYPPGLFASECRDGKLGLDCPALPPTEAPTPYSNLSIVCNPSHFVMLTAAFLLMTLEWF